MLVMLQCNVMLARVPRAQCASDQGDSASDVLHVDQAPPPLWSRHSPSNGPCMTRSWTNIGLLACRRVVCGTCVLKPPSPAA
eukprot:scaffold74651_cov105-Phaeocystis_antarctica.AAC.1